MEDSIYEIIDCTSDENYWTLGLFLDVQSAIDAISACNDPNDLGGDHECYEEGVDVVIRERKIGWGGVGRTVYRVAYENEYDEKKDEYAWVRIIKDPKEIK